MQFLLPAVSNPKGKNILARMVTGVNSCLLTHEVLAAKCEVTVTQAVETVEETSTRV